MNDLRRSEQPSEERETTFTKAELKQLLTYFESRNREEWYYGNKAQFEKRQENIIAIIKRDLERLK